MDQQTQPKQPAHSEVPQVSKKRLIILLGVFLVLAGITVYLLLKTTQQAPTVQTTIKEVIPETPSQDTPVFATRVMLDKLSHVWDIGFLPTGEMIYTERKGTLSIAKDGKVLQNWPVDTVKAVFEGGLMGMVVDPQFAKNHYVYACYNTTFADIRVTRFQLATDLTKIEAKHNIITGIPANTTTFPGRHSGCRLAFDAAANLWVSTGDAAQGDAAIQPKGLAGKILRVDREGRAVSGNVGGEFDARIYSYGHRNTQGLAFFPQPRKGIVGISAEHGPGRDDEVNLLTKGNFGWAPPAAGYNETVPMTDKMRYPDAIDAIWSSGEPTQAPSGAAIITGKAWKGWDGAVAVAMLKAQRLIILRLDDTNRVAKEEVALENEFGRLRAVVMGPDGNLYVSSSNGKDDRIIQLVPRDVKQ